MKETECKRGPNKVVLCVVPATLVMTYRTFEFHCCNQPQSIYYWRQPTQRRPTATTEILNSSKTLFQLLAHTCFLFRVQLIRGFHWQTGYTVHTRLYTRTPFCARNTKICKTLEPTEVNAALHPRQQALFVNIHRGTARWTSAYGTGWAIVAKS